jgi:hypothetical protein
LAHIRQPSTEEEKVATSRWERFAPLTGALFVLLTAASVVVTMSGAPEDFPAPVDEIVEYYTASMDEILIGSWLGLLGAFFLVWFAGSVRARLRDVGEERLGTVALGGAAAAAAISTIIDGTNLIATLRVEEYDQIAPETATALFDLANMLTGAALPIMLSVFIAAASVAALRAGGLPKWLAVFGLVTAVGLLILPIAWLVLLLALVWALITSILLYTSQPAAGTAAPATTAPPGPPA